MNNKSSVDYAIDELCKIILFYAGDEQNDKIATIKEQAKAMHKQEIEKLEQEIKFLKTYIKMYETK